MQFRQPYICMMNYPSGTEGEIQKKYLGQPLTSFPSYYSLHRQSILAIPLNMEDDCFWRKTNKYNNYISMFTRNYPSGKEWVNIGNIYFAWIRKAMRLRAEVPLRCRVKRSYMKYVSALLVKAPRGVWFSKWLDSTLINATQSVHSKCIEITPVMNGKKCSACSYNDWHRHLIIHTYCRGKTRTPISGIITEIIKYIQMCGHGGL